MPPPTAEVAARLGQGAERRSGRGYMTLCPCHEDHDPSLWLCAADDGGVAYSCKAGCDTRTVGAELARRGLIAAPGRTPRPDPLRWTYYDAQDQPVGLVERIDKADGSKSYPQSRYEAGAFLLGLNGAKLPLYRLPRVIKAVQAGRLIFVAEGEKCADALVELGLDATTSPGGAGKWKATHAEPLKGARVVVLPDNDAPGRKHAEDVARSLAGIAAEVRVVELPGLPEKGDVFDWLRAGGTRARLEALVEAARPAEEAPRFTLHTGSDLASQPSTGWLIKNVVPRTGVIQIIGFTGSGKTFLVMDLGLALAATHTPWYGYRLSPAPVVYVVLEGAGGFLRRLQAWEQHTERGVPDTFRVVTDPFRVNNVLDVEALAEAVKTAFPGRSPVTIIDTQSQAAPDCDENSSADMGRIVAGSQTLARLTNGLVVLVHHVGKDSTKGARGHSSQFASLDAAIEVVRTAHGRFWRIAKSKDGIDGTQHPFELKVVELGVDEDGDLVTSCIVEESGHAPPKAKARTPSEEVCYQSFLDAARKVGTLDPADRFAGLHLEAWRDAFYAASTADSQDAKKRAFLRARTELVARGDLAVKEDLYRPDGVGAFALEEEFSHALRGYRDTGHNGTKPGHCPGAPPSSRDTPGHTPIGVSRVPPGAGGSDPGNWDTGQPELFEVEGGTL